MDTEREVGCMCIGRLDMVAEDMAVAFFASWRLGENKK